MPYGPQVLWPTHCVQGTPGAAFHPDLDTDHADLVLRKGFRPQVDSYSAFFENDRDDADRARRLPARARRAARSGWPGSPPTSASPTRRSTRSRLGFAVTLLEDACREIDLDGSHAAALRADGRGRRRLRPRRRARLAGMTDIATRVHDHTWRIDPIVRSLLDTDFYKLLMLQTVFRRHADVTGRVQPDQPLAATCRSPRLIDEDDLRAQLDHIRGLRLSRGESRPGCAATPSTASAGCSGRSSWPGSRTSACRSTGWSAGATSTS